MPVVAQSSRYFGQKTQLESKFTALCKKDFHHKFSNGIEIVTFKCGQAYGCDNVHGSKYQEVEGFSTILVRYWNIECENPNSHRSGTVVFLKQLGDQEIPSKIRKRLFNDYFYTESEIRKMKISKLNGN